MSKNKTTPSVLAKVSVLYIKPTLVAATECPHCKEFNFVEVCADQKNKTILHPCFACDDDYLMQIPSFSPVK